MKTLIKKGDNLGGLISVWVIPYNVFFVSGKTVSFSDTTDIYKLYCSPESLKFQEDINNKESRGLYYSTGLEVFIPANVEDIDAAVHFLEPRRHVVLFLDQNENCKLAGTRFYPLKLFPSFHSGEKTADRSGWQFKFSGNTLSRAVKVDNPFS